MVEDLQGEIWKDIPDYEGYYMASNMGRIKSLPRFYVKKDKILRESPTIHGYVAVALHGANRKAKRKVIHRIIASSFWGKSDLYIDHINGVRTDNRLENLRYCTQRENVGFYYVNKNISKAVGVTFLPDSQKWRCRIYFKKKFINLGCHATKENAIAIRRAKEIELGVLKEKL